MISMENLKLNTENTDSLTSDWTEKAFRGQVDDHGFKLISSEIGRGAVCVLIGDFNGKSGEIEIRIHKAFKILFSVLMLIPFVGFVIEILMIGIEGSLSLIIPVIMSVLILRFVLIEFIFRFISNTGIRKLNDFLEIKELNEK